MSLEWNDLQVFLTVIRRGGYAAAAPRLEMVAATVRRRINDLESRFGEPLLQRASSGRLTPTLVGKALAARAEAMEAAVEAVLAAATREREEAAGVVRVAVSELIAQYLLPKVFARLLRSHPGLSIALIAQNGPAPFDPDLADVGLVLVEPSGPAVIGLPLTTFEMGLFARRDLLERIGRPTTPADLISLPLAGAPGHPLTWEIYAQLGLKASDLTFRVHTDTFAGQLSAVRSGAAIGACNAAIAATLPDVERVLPEFLFAGRMWAAMDALQAGVKRVRIVHQALAEAIMGVTPDRPAEARP